MSIKIQCSRRIKPTRNSTHYGCSKRQAALFAAALEKEVVQFPRDHLPSERATPKRPIGFAVPDAKPTSNGAVH
jgi:hypothetical protein